MAVTHSTLWDTVKELVLEQYKDSTNLVSLIRTMVEECAQPLEDGAFSLQDVLNLDDAEGEWLDLIGKLVGLKRYGGESDVDFKTRIERAATNISAGTPNSVIYNSAIMSSDPNPAYIDEAPATFFVYTGKKPTESGPWQEGGRQLKRREVQQLAPAGVLGVPGEAIQFGDGSFMGDAEGRLVLAVADDGDTPFVTDFVFITDQGARFITDADALLVGQTIEG